ncbi:NUDIX domain-containing protein [uncultured Succinatimonas sp.]|uniref:NUDIX domain-containing protein n=1 Tax=uncultured Succinatimonas sp. TaxID=1262973 RepID=UPI0025F4F634|nr:NUDIX domain-containing protein [uncultured Succinatimonas sp.]
MADTELVDIVNENNEVIDTVFRKEMRQKHLPHRASYIAYCDRQNRFLVEVRTLTKDYAPGLLDACIGGVIDSGENFAKAARRELLEEVGVDSTKIDFYDLGFEKIPSGDLFLYGYLCFAKGDAITVRQESEVSGILYLKEEELLKLENCCVPDSLYAFKKILEKAREQGYYK